MNNNTKSINMLEIMLNPLTDLFKHFDQEILNTKKLKKKQEILLQMFIIECKYNLDIFDVIDFKEGKFEHSECSEILELLSSEAMERVLVFESQSSSFLTEKLIKLFSKVSTRDTDMKLYIKDKNKVLNLYKRILVLKSLSKISPNNSLKKEIRFKIRIKNLKKIILQILENNGNI